MNEISESTDKELSNLLKASINRQPAPKDARARILKSAADIKAHQQNKKAGHHQSTNLPEDLFSWAIVYCIDRRIATLRLIS